MKLPRHRLMLAVKTYWNSQYHMLKHLIEQRWVVCTVLSNRDVTSLSYARTIDMTDNRWSLMASMLLILEQLQIAITALTAENTVTLSIIQAIIHGLMENHLKMADDAPVRNLKVTVSQDLARSFAKFTSKLSGRVPVSVTHIQEPQLLLYYHEGGSCITHEGWNRHYCQMAAAVELTAEVGSDSNISVPAAKKRSKLVWGSSPKFLPGGTESVTVLRLSVLDTVDEFWALHGRRSFWSRHLTTCLVAEKQVKISHHRQNALEALWWSGVIRSIWMNFFDC